MCCSVYLSFATVDMFLFENKTFLTGYVANLKKQIDNNKSILTKTNKLINRTEEDRQKHY